MIKISEAAIEMSDFTNLDGVFIENPFFLSLFRSNKCCLRLCWEIIESMLIVTCFRKKATQQSISQAELRQTAESRRDSGGCSAIWLFTEYRLESCRQYVIQQQYNIDGKEDNRSGVGRSRIPIFRSQHEV